MAVKEVQPLGEVNRGVSRRTIAKGAAWTVPAVAVASATPAVAASLIKYPGINGWVSNRPVDQPGSCNWTLEIDSTLPGAPNVPGFTDGAPYGLYIYDVEPSNTFSNAQITYWILGTQSSITWAELSGHSDCWSAVTQGDPAIQTDGNLYTPYTWTYKCEIDAADFGDQGDSDGVPRLYLGDFHVRATFRNNYYNPPGPAYGNSCENITYWIDRRITVDPDGPGGQAAENKCFKRRNGTMGTYNPPTVLGYC